MDSTSQHGYIHMHAHFRVETRSGYLFQTGHNCAGQAGQTWIIKISRSLVLSLYGCYNYVLRAKELIII